MSLPSISDVSPLYRELKAKSQQLRHQEGKIESELQELYELIQSGKDPDRERRVAALVKGETITGFESIRTRYENLRTQWSDVKEAGRAIIRKMAEEAKRAEGLVRERLAPQHETEMNALCDGLSKAHTAFSKLYHLRTSMTADGIGLGRLFEPWPGFLESPFNKAGALVEFLNEASRAGYCAAPKGAA